MQLMVLMPNWIGDAVMATPALRAVRAMVPGARLVGVMRPLIAELLAGTHFFDQIIYYDPRSDTPAQHFWPVIRQVRQEKPDVFLCLTNSLRAGLLAWCSGASRRIGWAGGLRRWMMSPESRSIQRGSARQPMSALDYYLDIARAVGASTADRRLELATRPRDEVAADESLRRLNLCSHRPLLVLNNGGAYGPAKNWPVEHFATLARRWAECHDCNVLVICGPAEREAAAAIESMAAHPRVRSLAHFEPDLGRTKACIRRARLMISTDSGSRHIAAAFGVPVVAIFGPTDPRWSENYHAGQEIVRLTLDCQPCARRACPLGHHRCMRDLTVEHVWPAAVRLWSQTVRRAQAS
jgi:heptosyltransferase-2